MLFPVRTAFVLEALAPRLAGAPVFFRSTATVDPKRRPRPKATSGSYPSASMTTMRDSEPRGDNERHIRRSSVEPRGLEATGRPAQGCHRHNFAGGGGGRGRYAGRSRGRGARVDSRPGAPPPRSTRAIRRWPRGRHAHDAERESDSPPLPPRRGDLVSSISGTPANVVDAGEGSASRRCWRERRRDAGSQRAWGWSPPAGARSPAGERGPPDGGRPANFELE